MKATQTMIEDMKELVRLATEAADRNKKSAQSIITVYRVLMVSFLGICVINSRWDFLVLCLFFTAIGILVCDAIFVKNTGLIPSTFMDILKGSTGFTVNLVIYFIDKFDRNPLFTRTMEKEIMAHDDEPDDITGRNTD